MVAAEIAATSPERVDRMVLIAPLGLWRDDHPVPDISGVPPATLPGLLFAEPDGPLAALMPAPDPSDPESLLRAAMTMASILQFIWPLPDKGLRKRLYRVRARHSSSGVSRTALCTRRTATTSSPPSPVPASSSSPPPATSPTSNRWSRPSTW